MQVVAVQFRVRSALALVITWCRVFTRGHSVNTRLHVETNASAEFTRNCTATVFMEGCLKQVHMSGGPLGPSRIQELD